jgi:protein-S-isoprenylcysteine O-methyltransferase Ste14
MTQERAMRILAASAIIWAGATPYFLLFWTWFDHWRKHRAQTYTLMFGTLVAVGAATYGLRDFVFGMRIVIPGWGHGIGWVLVGLSTLLGFVADRQIGIRVRSFTPFFETGGRIELKTSGAYGVVRHPIYAAGIGYQLGVFLVTGYVAVIVAWDVLVLGALWFTRQEERRLIELLADPTEYERYRAEVPALFPWRPRWR